MKKKTFHLVHILPLTDFKEESTNAQNMKFSVKVNKYEQIFNFLWICSNLQKTLKRKFHFFCSHWQAFVCFDCQSVRKNI